MQLKLSVRDAAKASQRQLNLYIATPDTANLPKGTCPGNQPLLATQENKNLNAFFKMCMPLLAAFMTLKCK